MKKRRLLASVKMLSLTLPRLIPGGKKMEKKVYDQVIRHVMGITDKEFADLSVATLANSLKIDRYKLSRQFKLQTEMTVEEFLFKEKMARAAFLLKSAVGMTVKDVSERIGFCTSDYFIRKFKKYYGIAPGKYKEFKTILPEFEKQISEGVSPTEPTPKREMSTSRDFSIRHTNGKVKEIKQENPCAYCHYKSFALHLRNSNSK
jgi:AraC-like DNA-binding protein